ncbi:MAG: DUF4157 domain-containing protein [Cyanobacteria bacterium P01_G01_bin.67]
MKTRPKHKSSFELLQTGLLQRKCSSCGQHSVRSGECPKCHKKQSYLQRRPSNQNDTYSEVSSIVNEVLRSPGQSLPLNTKTFMESGFGHDFSHVKVHTDSKAAESAQAVNALAYTVGDNIVFGAGQYTPNTNSGKQLLAHELTHTIQQRYAIKNLQSKTEISQSGDIAEREAETVSRKIVRGQQVSVRSQTNAGLFRQLANDENLTSNTAGNRQENELEQSSTLEQISNEYTQPGWQNLNQLGIVRVEEEGAKIKGANLRRDASTSGAPLLRLEENTKVRIIAENKKNGWLYVNVFDKQHKGSFGYVASHLVWSNLPDPGAVLYYVKDSGQGLQKLVENQGQYQGYNIRTGDDARSIIMAVYLANEQDSRTKGNVYINQDKLEKAQNPSFSESLKDELDEYRRVLRPILQSVELQQNKKIWLPSPSYIESIKKAGILPSRSELKNVAIAASKGIGGFVSGLSDGFLSSIVDIFVGVYDLIKEVISLVIDLISGDAIRAAQDIYNLLEEMSADEILKLLKNAIVGFFDDLFADFSENWNAKNTFNKWHFRGKVIGYILAEVLIILLSGGTANAAKWLGKLGKVGDKLATILNNTLGKAESLLDKALPGRKASRKSSNQDVESAAPEGSKESKEWPIALSLAKTITEAHDKKDSSIKVLKSSLQPLKRKFGWIKRFDTTKIAPGQYQVFMIGSKYVVDRDYTTKATEDLRSETTESLSLETAILRGIISEQEIVQMRRIVSELRDSIISKVARDRNTVAVALFEMNGERAFAFSVNRNKFSRSTRTGQPHPINQKAEELGVLRIDAEPRIRTRSRSERATAGAPEDAEQILIEGAEANNIDLIAILPSRPACKACSSIVPQEGIILIPPS